jgi:hypothetical protein
LQLLVSVQFLLPPMQFHPSWLVKVLECELRKLYRYRNLHAVFVSWSGALVEKSSRHTQFERQLKKLVQKIGSIIEQC